METPVGTEMTKKFKEKFLLKKSCCNQNFNKDFVIHSKNKIPEEWSTWLKEKGIGFIEDEK